MYVEYSSNNSGGSWWLTDENWKALEQAGWVVEWYTHDTVTSQVGDRNEPMRDEHGVPVLAKLNGKKYGSISVDKDGRFLGALATKAYRGGLNLRDAVFEWESITGSSALDAGCSCCGQPHYFTEFDSEGNYVTDGPHASYSCEW